MGKNLITEVVITQLGKMETKGGKVLHAMKNIDAGFKDFGEAYFSTIEKGVVRAWKRHRSMTLNLIVPVGKIRFVLLEEISESTEYHHSKEIILSDNNYCRLTIPPMIWVGFQGLDDGLNLLLNIADLVHDPEESDHKDIKDVNFMWDN